MVSMDYKTLDEAYNAGRRIGIEQGVAYMMDYTGGHVMVSQEWVDSTIEALLNKAGFRLYCNSLGMIATPLVDNKDDKE